MHIAYSHEGSYTFLGNVVLTACCVINHTDRLRLMIKSHILYFISISLPPKIFRFFFLVTKLILIATLDPQALNYFLGYSRLKEIIGVIVLV